MGGFYLKTSAPLSLMKTYQKSLISARSISQDSTVKRSFNKFSIKLGLFLKSVPESAERLAQCGPAHTVFFPYF